MAQDAITSFWKKYSGILGSDINEKMGYGSKLVSFFKQVRKPWKEQSGHTLNHIQYDRVGITADADAEYTDDDNAAYAEPIKSNSTTNYGGSSSGGALNTGNNVDPPMDVLDFNKSELEYGLIQKGFQTGDFSIEDLRAAAENADQLDSVTTLISDYAQESWLRTYRDEFSRVAGKRFVATDAAGLWTTNSTANDCFDATQATRWNNYGYTSNGTYVTNAATIDTPDKQGTSRITWRHLDDLALRMLQEDPAGKYASAMANGMPVGVFVTDALTVRRLINEASTGGYGVRTDIRESSKADDLLKGLGVDHAINGWILLADITPRKFDIVGDSADSSGATGTGTWDEELFLTAGGSNNRILNSAYTSADYVESYAFYPKAWSSYNPTPNYSGVTDAKFHPQDYTGDYSFEVIKDKALNPFGAHGYFQGKIATGTVAQEKDLMYVIRHRVGDGFGAS